MDVNILRFSNCILWIGLRAMRCSAPDNCHSALLERNPEVVSAYHLD
jgi:hypothetical protein